MSSNGAARTARGDTKIKIVIPSGPEGPAVCTPRKNVGGPIPGGDSSLQEEHQRHQTVSPSMRDDPRNQTLPPQGNPGQQRPDKQHREQARHSLIEMPLREQRYLDDRSQPDVSVQRLALPLHVAAKDELLHKSRTERERQKRQCFSTILSDHRTIRCSVV